MRRIGRLLGITSNNSRAPLVLVWLLRGPREIDEDAMRKGLSAVFGERFAADSKAPNCFIASKGPLYLFRFRGAVLGVINEARPYVKDPVATAEEFKEVHLQQAMREHRAFIAVEWPGTIEVTSKALAYRTMGKVMAELAGDDCLAIYSPTLGKMNWYQPGLVEKLRGKDPLSALKVETGIVQSMGNVEKMMNVVAEVQRRWPEFASAFSRGSGKAPFAVLAAFEDRERREFMWVDVTQIEGEFVHGVLRNKPNRVRGVRAGQKVRVPLGDVVDWIYGEEGKRYGGFTTDARV